MECIRRGGRRAAAAFLLQAIVASAAFAADAPQPSAEKTAPATAQAPLEPSIYIRAYRVYGAHLLSDVEVEQAVYPFLGPERTREDVEKAREALQKAYQAKGYSTVVVEIPPQQVKGGIVKLQAVEKPVGRLRVTGSRYYSPEEIKKQADSLAAGTVPDFSDNGPVAHDIAALNQLPDRRVTPVLRAGETPDTVDVDLQVKDTFPLHGSVELNNRYSINTTELRVDGSLSYNNLWQAGHSAGVSFQIAPQNIPDGEVYSAYYLARFPGLTWLTLMLEGTKQDSNVSSLGGSNVVGKGETAGIRAIISLPGGKDFYQSVALGIDFKHYDQDLMLSGSDISTPTTYFPLSASYNANWVGKGYSTELNTEVTFNIRGLGSNLEDLDNSRYHAGGNFIYVRGDLSHEHDLPGGFQVFGKLQGQLADQPLLNSEQISGGGLSTVRGYLESTVLGDDGIFASGELRTPSLGFWSHGVVQDWRFYAFGDWGAVSVIDPLPDQQESFTLASFGGGAKIRVTDYLNGSLDVGFPLIGQTGAKPWDPRLTFRIWSEF